jgi:hypothetical protein
VKQDAMRTTLIPVALAASLMGCADTPFRLEQGWTEQRVLRYTWLTPQPFDAEPAYCYHTLAKPDCYSRPQPREAARMVGYIGPEPY